MENTQDQKVVETDIYISTKEGIHNDQVLCNQCKEQETHTHTRKQRDTEFLEKKDVLTLTSDYIFLQVSWGAELALGYQKCTCSLLYMGPSALRTNRQGLRLLGGYL